MKSKRKFLQVTVQYDDTNEMIRSVEKMLGEIKMARTNFGRELKNGCLIQWGVSLSDIEPYRVEEINGKMSIILQSKINVK
jgi:hypothetical protein